MKNNYLHIPQRNTEDFSFDQFMGGSPMDHFDPEMARIAMEDLFRREDGKIPPDTTAADKFFIDAFITPDMDYEFNRIANDFMKHNFNRLNEFDSLAWYDNSFSNQTSPSTAYQRRIMNIMYNAAKAGDPYSVELICYLYKTYHKKEYKTLKRFSKISLDELLGMAKDDEFGLSCDTLGRLLGMCTIYGVTMDESCTMAYLLLDRKRVDVDELERTDFYNFDENLFHECMDQLEVWMEDAYGKLSPHDERRYLKATKTFFDEEKFIELALQHEGYPGDYLIRCNEYNSGVTYIFAKTLALLKSAYPKKEFTFEDVQKYAHLTIAIESLVCVSDRIDENLDQLFGIIDYPEEEAEEFLFHPEAVVYREEKDKPVERKVTQTVSIAPVSNGSANDQDYMAEIAELRKKLSDKERENKNLRVQYEQVKTALGEAKASMKQYKNDREELVSLRNAMYEMSEDLPEVAEQSLEEMQEYIAKKRIIIIGGNDNWIKKIKQLFPNWRFISSNVSGSINSSMVQNADKVYFFTDTLAHSNYYRYLQVLRESQIPFGYLHGVNLNGNIKYIYNDMVEQ